MSDSTISISKLNFNLGQIAWNHPEGMNALLEQYKTSNYKEPGLDGYRVQIFSDGGNNAKERAFKVQNTIMELYPELEVYLTYQQPNFKIRCGNFRTKAEARKCQIEIMRDFPGCFIVRDMIKTIVK